ncbi:MAG TPA: nuclear transport factor 2 family protein [Rhizomicrobium sp.]
MSNANQLVVTYLAAWNERDQKKRRDLVATTWSDDGLYIDAHRSGSGHDEIEAMIGKVQGQFPGYRFSLASGIETHNGYVRFSWEAGGTQDAPLFVARTDFAVIAKDGRFRSVTGFTDAAPAPAA